MQTYEYSFIIKVKLIKRYFITKHPIQESLKHLIYNTLNFIYKKSIIVRKALVLIHQGNECSFIKFLEKHNFNSEVVLKLLYLRRIGLLF